MKAKRFLAFLLATVFMMSVAVTPVFAAAAPTETLPQETTALDESNNVVSIRLTAEGQPVYGSPFQLNVQANPENTQYLGFILGVGGEGKGFVTLLLSEKIRILLKLIPLPKRMSVTPDQEEEFNMYAYLKQLIDGNDVSVLLRVADEVVSVMDVLQFYMPTLKDISTGMKLVLELIRKYLPEGTFSRIYLDEQPTQAGNYIAGAVALESGDTNTAGVALFCIDPKSEGVSLSWQQEVPEVMTVEEAKAFNPQANLNDNGQVIADAKITYTYKQDDGFLSFLFGATLDSFPTEPGEYIETVKVGGNYSCPEISRTIVIQ